MHQVAEQPVQSVLAVELIRKETHNRLNLFVGVDDKRATRQLDVADGRQVEHRARARLLSLPWYMPRSLRMCNFRLRS